MGLIPKKWEASNTGGRNISQIIPNTNFIAFKTPLSEELFAQSSYDERFKVSDILDATGIKMWINLVGQHRRFDSAEIIAQNVEYFEMQVEGGGMIPSEMTVVQFINKVKSAPPGTRIGVHCSHGLNRTGYFICRYMMDELGIEAEEAIRLFETARGTAIRKKSLTQHLLSGNFSELND